ncbi:hypothetical protein FJ420_21325 [Mesorhizobium sp. B3-1-3]|uniref:hypothetical protein n=1 Tax=unclassified Mesorhizobium TaxID=325217 RepID=UPI00112AAD95|nr:MULTISPECIES: hypothetical protein [unclassified Mesorhizobium]TPI59858.1 hypothetical protein FJ424_24750 [Mesorhizobium sp. B3-1-8]TPI68230.1 hypothetical protein FJ420_21325 [Mesorhizobium sp. B3-1-3]
MTDKMGGTFDSNFDSAEQEVSRNGIPFGGTISSIFLMATLAIGAYLLYVSITNDFPPIWKAGYWVCAIFTLLITMAWTVSICGRYGVGIGHMIGGVLLSSLAVIFLALTLWLAQQAQGAPGSGGVLVIILAAIFGIAALAVNVMKTNLVFGTFLTAVQLTFSLVLLVGLILFLGMRSSRKY